MPVPPPADEQAGTDEPWGGVGPRNDVWPTPSQELLLRATILPHAGAVAAWHELKSKLDLTALDGAAASVVPFMRRNLLALGAQDEVLDGLEGAHRLTWARNQLLFNRTLPVVGELERAGIPTLLLKGAALAAGSPDAGLRAMVDVDVLVPRDRSRAAIEVLAEHGLAPVGGVPVWFVSDYAPRYVPSHGFEGERDCQLDLHWHLLHSACRPGADDDFWAAARPLEMLGVRTRGLCPTDELLHVVLHGLRWSAIPTYRWVLDGMLLLAGGRGPIDFDRLVRQARRLDVAVALRAGLRYLRRVFEAPVPEPTMRELRAVRRLRLERLEFRAQITQPRHRSPIARAVFRHQQYARRHLPVGDRATLARRVGLVREQLGIVGWRDLRHVLSGGSPGPGRPESEMAAAVGTGTVDPALGPVHLDESLEFGPPGTGQHRVAYGAWLAEPGGCWLAGREARIMLELERAPTTSLLLNVWGDGFLNVRRPRQRLEILANGRRVGRLILEASGPALVGVPILLPLDAVAGREALTLTLRTPDARSPAQLRLADDDRRLGVFLQRLLLRAPRACPIGGEIRLGQDSGDEGVLLDGWSTAEDSGRWTVGPQAQMLLRVEGCPRAFEVEVEATPFLGRPGRGLEVDLSVNGHRAWSMVYADARAGALRQRACVTPGMVGPHGEVLLAWRIANPISPLELGLSADTRSLGLFLRRVSLVGAAGD